MQQLWLPIEATDFFMFASIFGCGRATVLLCFLAQVISAQPIYRFNTNADAFLRLAFPTPHVRVDITRAYAERTNLFVPVSFDDILNKNNTWVELVDANGSFQIQNDVTESYWLSLLGRFAHSSDQISAQLLSATNTQDIIVVCSNLVSGSWQFPSVTEKALFQRDVFQLYDIFAYCTNFSKVDMDRTVLVARDRTQAALKSLLTRLRLQESDYQELTNNFTEDMAEAANQHRFELENPFDLSHKFLPLPHALDGTGWYEMRFGSIGNRHFNHFWGRSFVRVFARTPGWSQEQLYAYWDEVNQKFGQAVHVSPDVPPVPAGTQLMLVRTFAVLLTDGTLADSGIPEEVLIRAFKTSEDGLDLNSSDFRGTYFYEYKLSRRLLLRDPASLGLVRHLDDDPVFFGFNTEVPDLGTALDAGLTTMRYNCIICHAQLHYGSSTFFSLEKPRLKDSKADQFEGSFLRPVAGKPGRYGFGRLNEYLGLDN